MSQHKSNPYERYSFADSPWRQKLTQSDLGALVGMTKDQLERLVDTKERWTKRFDQEIGGKQRSLAVPVGKLRTVHERLKYHLNKISQPDYLFSPRKGRGQRDNAEHHSSGVQFVSLDIKQFYPSTTSEHIFRWAYHDAGLRSDVAGLFTKLVTVDGKMPFGSPISPVLTTHVHRSMFDAIHTICAHYELTMSLWVDDLVISGDAITGDVVTAIRGIIARNGFKSHKIKFRISAKPVIITGVPLYRGRVTAPRSLHQRVQQGYATLRNCSTDAERIRASSHLLSALGTYRYHVGSKTPEGRLASNRMHALRQRRSKMEYEFTTKGDRFAPVSAVAAQTDLPWD